MCRSAMGSVALDHLTNTENHYLGQMNEQWVNYMIYNYMIYNISTDRCY